MAVTHGEVIALIRALNGEGSAAQAAEYAQAAEDARDAAEEAQAAAEEAADQLIIDTELSGSSEHVVQNKVITGQINNVKSQLYNSAISIEGNDFEWEVGALSVGAGSTSSSTTRIRTKNFVPYGDVIGFSALSGYQLAVFVYAADGTYSGALKDDGTLTKGSATGIWASERLLSAFMTSKFKVVMRNANDTSAEMSASEGSNCKVIANIINGLSDICTKIGPSIRDLSAGDNIVTPILSGTTQLKSGVAINGSGANVSSPTSYSSDFIPCTPGDLITSALTLAEAVQSWFHYIAFYNSSKAFVSRDGDSKLATAKATVPENCAFFRVSLTYVGTGNVSRYSLDSSIVNENLSASQRNKWYILGDSISAGYYSMTASMAQAAGVTFDYNSPVTTEDGEATGSVWDKSLSHNYWGYANNRLKRDLVGKAYPGQGYFRSAANAQNGVYVVTHNDFSDAGLITVAWGFNDWHYNQVRGNHDLIDESVPYPGEDYDTDQISTINHAIWFCLGELIRQAPNAKIVVQTPMNGWAYGGDWSTDWGIGYEMSDSGTLANIHDDIVYWADYYGLQILEMTYNNSIVNRRNIKDTIIDGSHPSDVAHQQLGRHVAIALKYY